MSVRKRSAVSRPLDGWRVLVTRPRQRAAALAEDLRRAGAQVVELPLIKIEPPSSFRPLDRALRRLQGYDWLILTSVNGVEAMFRRLRKLRMTPNSFSHLQVATIGPATAGATRRHGLRVAMVPREYVAEAVVRALRRRVHGKRILLVRARVARDVIPLELRMAGARVDVVEAYRTAPALSARIPLLNLLSDPRRRPHVMTFTSPSTVQALTALLREQAYTGLLDGVRFASIGPVTSRALRAANLRVDIEAKQYTAAGLAQATIAMARSSR